MPDITLRFHKDMLVLSSPVAVVLARQGFDVEHDLEFANLVEPEAVRDALRLNKMAGAQCLVANTEGIAPARLAHRGMEDRAAEIVRTGLSLARELKSSTCWWRSARAASPSMPPAKARSTRTATSTPVPPAPAMARSSTRSSSTGSPTRPTSSARSWACAR